MTETRVKSRSQFWFILADFLTMSLWLLLVAEMWFQSDITLCNKNREFESVSRATKIAQNQKLPNGKKSANIKPISKAVCYQKTTPMVEFHKLINIGIKIIKKT
jgi:hypothetical protein